MGSSVQLYSLAETPQLPTSSRIWAHMRGSYWSAKIDDISLYNNPLVSIHQVNTLSNTHKYNNSVCFDTKYCEFLILVRPCHLRRFGKRLSCLLILLYYSIFYSPYSILNKVNELMLHISTKLEITPQTVVQ